MTGSLPFVHPWLLVGSALIAVPIVIHLLNRLRYRRVRWAAMDFLLESQRRNRRRLLLEEWLLLLLRMSVVALFVLAVARPILSGGLGSLLAGNAVAEHIVLLDDSASMGQVQGQETAFDRACRAVIELGQAIGQKGGSSTWTLIRTSAPSAPEWERVELDSRSIDSVRETLARLKPGYLSRSPVSEIESVIDRLSAKVVLHIVSDFQAGDWPADGSFPSIREKVSASGARLRLIDVTNSPPENASVASIVSRTGSQATSVAVPLEVGIRSASGAGLSNVVVTPRLDGAALPALAIESLPVGETVVRSFDVASPRAGLHEVRVSIERDGLAADNTASLALDLDDDLPVLLVDGSRDRRDSFFVSTALAPGEPARTGVAPTIRRPQEVAPEDWKRYRAVYLLDVPRLDDRQTQSLREYVAAGGGLALFLGPSAEVSYYRSLAEPASALLPMSLDGIRESDAPTEGSDLTTTDHPIFRIFAGERNSYLETLAFSRWWGIDPESLATGARILAKHRSGDPLAIESTLGKGRVISWLTSAGDAWHSWPQNPTFVLLMLMTNDYLLTPTTPQPTVRVGEPWKLTWDLADYRRDVLVHRPALDDEPVEPDRQEATIVDQQAVLVVDDANIPGIYKITRTRPDGTTQTLGQAFQLDPKESSLEKIDPENLAKHWSGVPHEYIGAEAPTTWSSAATFEPKDAILGLLALILIAEQSIAYRLSFHRPAED
jgi:hypothetical protein